MFKVGWFKSFLFFLLAVCVLAAIVLLSPAAVLIYGLHCYHERRKPKTRTRSKPEPISDKQGFVQNLKTLLQK